MELRGVLVFCVVLCQTEGRVIRKRRQDCQDGTYDHEGTACCKCSAGSMLVKHCNSVNQTRCDWCPTSTFRSVANSETACEPCTSCTQPNANLEVDRQCTSIADSTCKCKTRHFCLSGILPCKICEPCQECGSKGINVSCSATKNTICNDDEPHEPRGNTKIVVGIIVALVVLVVLGIVVAYCFKKRRESNSRQIDNNDGTQTEELQPLKFEELQKNIPDVAETIGWEIMCKLAMKSGITDVQIENCKLDNPNKINESTIALLQIWGEKEGRNANQKLYKYLKDKGQNMKAEKVREILTVAASS